MNTAYIADKQFVTAQGISTILQQNGFDQLHTIDSKSTLIQQLTKEDNAVVVIDYTLFDLNSHEELIVLSHRFPSTYWLLLSTTLNSSLVRQLYFAIPHIAFLSKEATQNDFYSAIQSIKKQQKYTCLTHTEHLRLPHQEKPQQQLTHTEREILIAIASGHTTKEIAQQRNISTHTVITHRKNIFKKIDVNNLHEATKYAIRAGLINLTEYYI